MIDLDVGGITMSWSFGAVDAAPALAEVERYLPVFERHGYVAYDPQLERVYDPARDRSDAAAMFRNVDDRVLDTSQNQPVRAVRGGDACSLEVNGRIRVRRLSRTGRRLTPSRFIGPRLHTKKG